MTTDKFCTNCINHTQMGNGHYCTRRIDATAGTNLVDGSTMTVMGSGRYSPCDIERRETTLLFRTRCGQHGHFFVPGASKITGRDLSDSTNRLLV